MIAEQSHHAFFVTRSLDDRKMGSLETIFQNESEEIVEILNDRKRELLAKMGPSNDRSEFAKNDRWNDCSKIVKRVRQK